jgi:hypothetical protein
VGNCVKSAKVIRDTQAAYENAPVIIASISSETSVLCLSLSHLQAMLLSRHDMPNLLDQRPEFALALDTALTGCTVVFRCLDKEFQKFSSAASPSFKDKGRLVWNQDTFRELLDALRGQQIALNLLLQLSQVESLVQIKELMIKGQPSLVQAMQRSESLRHSFIDVEIPQSILGLDDSNSIVTYQDDMVESGFQFLFDDVVINSRVYQRAMASAMARSGATDSSTDQQNTSIAIKPTASMIIHASSPSTVLTSAPTAKYWLPSVLHSERAPQVHTSAMKEQRRKPLVETIPEQWRTRKCFQCHKLLYEDDSWTKLGDREIHDSCLDGWNLQGF